VVHPRHCKAPSHGTQCLGRELPQRTIL